MEKTIKGQGDFADDVHPERSVDLGSFAQLSQQFNEQRSERQKPHQQQQQQFYPQLYAQKEVLGFGCSALTDNQQQQLQEIGYFYKKANMLQSTQSAGLQQHKLQALYEDSILNASIADETKNHSFGNANGNGNNQQNHKSSCNYPYSNNVHFYKSNDLFDLNQANMHLNRDNSNELNKIKDSNQEQNHQNILNNNNNNYHNPNNNLHHNEINNQLQQIDSNSNLPQNIFQEYPSVSSAANLSHPAPPIFRLEMKPQKHIHSMTEKKNNQDQLYRQQRGIDPDALEQMDPECMLECSPQLIPRFTYCVNMPQNIPKEQSYEALRSANQQKFRFLKQATLQLDHSPVIDNYRSFLNTSYNLAKDKPEECAHLLMTLETQFDLILHVSVQVPKEHSKIVNQNKDIKDKNDNRSQDDQDDAGDEGFV